MKIAFFITPHGFGHAARSSAIMEALLELDAGCAFEIFSQVPEWFFEPNLSGSFVCHKLACDLGLVQKGPFHEDAEATARSLDAFLPFDGGLVRTLAGRLRGLGCKAVVCDIAPLGIVVAAEAGLPSVLVENFTWDWIYRVYADEVPAMERHAAYLERIFGSAGVRIQTEPVCARIRGAALVTAPVGRRPRSPAAAVRRELGVPEGEPLVTITLGGLSRDHGVPPYLKGRDEAWFLVPSGGAVPSRDGRTISIPFHSHLYHPDLIAASDAVIGKIGYSTLAEAFQAGTPFGYIPRGKFRESGPLCAYVEAHGLGAEVGEAEFSDGGWLARLPALLRMPRGNPLEESGAKAAAKAILGAAIP